METGAANTNGGTLRCANPLRPDDTLTSETLESARREPVLDVGTAFRLRCRAEADQPAGRGRAPEIGLTRPSRPADRRAGGRATPWMYSLAWDC